MSSKLVIAGLCVVGLLGVVPACQQPPTTGDLDSLTEDANENGFLDVEPPDGVEFSTIDNVNIRLANSINQADLAVIAEQYGVDASLLGLATIVAEFTVTMDYGDGVVDVLFESEYIAPFDKKFEVACPIGAEIYVEVRASAPVVGDMTLFEATFEATEGVQYQCGDTFGYETYVDENGNPGVLPL